MNVRPVTASSPVMNRMGFKSGHESYGPNWHDIAKAQRGEYGGGVVDAVKQTEMSYANEFTESCQVL